ncbi:MAG: efflux RND transporter periplasmic adaptor subunit [Planctomycetota bacterium]
MPPTAPASHNRLVAFATRVGIAVVMLGLAGTVFYLLQSTKPEIEQIDPAANAQTVLAFEARRVPVQRQWRGYGTAQPLDSAEVPVRVTATVESIPPEILPGARVTRGQTLVQLDASDFSRQLEIAQQRIAELDAALAQLDVEAQRLEERLALEDADVAIARTEYDRQLRFRERNVSSQQDVDAAQRNLIAAQRRELQTREAADLIGPRRRSIQAQKASQQSQVNLAQLNEQRATITSPLTGVIQSLEVEVGENMAAGSTLARIVALDPIEVPVGLEASAQQSVRPGDRVELRPTNQSAPAPVWNATVVRVAPEQDAQTRTFTVFADLTRAQGAPPLPVPGAYLEARVYVSEPESRFIVPRRSIREGRLQVIEQGVVVSRPVEIDYTLSGPQPRFGLPDDQWAVIGDTLREGQFVVVNAAAQLADGTRAEPALPDRPAATAARPRPAEATP